MQQLTISNLVKAFRIETFFEKKMQVVMKAYN